MGAIKLPCGRLLLLDTIDIERFGHLPWRAKPAAQALERYYVFCQKDGRTTYIHRLILDAPPHLTVDHINGDGLDNTRANLRLATRAQNNANRLVKNITGFRGVCRKGNRFRAYISGRAQTGRSHDWLGYFETAEAAARAYDAAAIERFGEFARLNFSGERP